MPNSISLDTAPSAFGQLLRHWRKSHNMSQLHLAVAANTSPRHLSFVETGRSRPGRDLILRLANVLEIPLRDQNALLVSAGLPPAYVDHSAESFLDHPLRAKIETILERHAPYPAVVFSGSGKVLLTNKPFDVLAPDLAAASPEETTHGFFSPEGGRKVFANWEAMAWAWLARTRKRIAQVNDPQDIRLLEIAQSYLSQEPKAPEFGAGAADVISPIWIINGAHIHTLTTVMRFDAPLEVCLSELKIELLFPADDAADAFFTALMK